MSRVWFTSITSKVRLLFLQILKHILYQSYQPTRKQVLFTHQSQFSLTFGTWWVLIMDPAGNAIVNHKVLLLQGFYGILRTVSDCMSNVMKHFKCTTAPSTVDLHILMNNSHIIQSFPLAFQLFPGFIYISFTAWPHNQIRLLEQMDMFIKIWKKERKCDLWWNLIKLGLGDILQIS